MSLLTNCHIFIHFKMSTLFYRQGLHFDLYGLPVSFLLIMDSLAILLVVPLFDRLIFPALKKRFNIVLSPLVRVGKDFLLIVDKELYIFSI